MSLQEQIRQLVDSVEDVGVLSELHKYLDNALKSHEKSKEYKCRSWMNELLPKFKRKSRKEYENIKEFLYRFTSRSFKRLRDEFGFNNYRTGVYKIGDDVEFKTNLNFGTGGYKLHWFYIDVTIGEEIFRYETSRRDHHYCFTNYGVGKNSEVLQKIVDKLNLDFSIECLALILHVLAGTDDKLTFN